MASSSSSARQKRVQRGDYAYTASRPPPPNRFMHYLIAQSIALPDGATWGDVLAGRYVVVHLNGDTLDNRDANLAWVPFTRKLRHVPKWSDGIDK